STNFLATIENMQRRTNGHTVTCHYVDKLAVRAAAGDGNSLKSPENPALPATLTQPALCQNRAHADR
ncbi:hypothetical protein, partial [Escherichia fergusonii]|uniref:hypothetical protein n=1 Tax=Escherichia fergusonii TaxID=564 RepID=UPI001E4E1665